MLDGTCSGVIMLFNVDHVCTNSLRIEYLCPAQACHKILCSGKATETAVQMEVGKSRTSSPDSRERLCLPYRNWQQTSKDFQCYDAGCFAWTRSTIQEDASWIAAVKATKRHALTDTSRHRLVTLVVKGYPQKQQPSCLRAKHFR